MKRAKERDSSETAAIKINRRKVCLLIIAIGIKRAAADYHGWACFIWKKAILDAIERKTMLALT